LVWRTELSGEPPDSVRCTRESNSELATFGNSGGCSAIIHRTVRCASRAMATSCQRSSVKALNALQCAPACVEVRAGARRRTGQSTEPVRCTTGLSGGPQVRAPMVEPKRLGDVAGAPDSVWWRTGLSGAPVNRSHPQRPFWWLGL
jgi:hypothetical protein